MSDMSRMWMFVIVASKGGARDNPGWYRNIEQTPEVASGYDASYLRGIAKLGDRLVILLDLAGLFGEADAASLAATAA